MMHVLMMTLLTLLTLIMTSTPAIVPDGQGIHHQIQLPHLSVRTKRDPAHGKLSCDRKIDKCLINSHCEPPLVCRYATGDGMTPDLSQPHESFPLMCLPRVKDLKPCRETGRMCRHHNDCCGCHICLNPRGHIAESFCAVHFDD